MTSANTKILSPIKRGHMFQSHPEITLSMLKNNRQSVTSPLLVMAKNEQSYQNGKRVV